MKRVQRYERWLISEFGLWRLLKLIAGILLIYYLPMFFPEAPPNNEEPRAVIQFPHAQIDLVEVADEETERERGLSNRSEPQAMLFLFETRFSPGFWMKDMRFPIDIVWIDGDKIVGIEKDLQPEDPPKTIYVSSSPMTAALELPAGTADAYALKIGDVLDIEWNQK